MRRKQSRNELPYKNNAKKCEAKCETEMGRTCQQTHHNVKAE